MATIHRSRFARLAAIGASLWLLAGSESALYAATGAPPRSTLR